MAVRSGSRPRFSAAGTRAMRYAATEAARLSPREVSRVHLLLGLVHARESIAGQVTAEVALTPGALWASIEVSSSGAISRMPRSYAAWWALRPRWTPGARDALADAIEAAAERGSTTVDTGDILLALSRSEARAAKILRRNGLAPAAAEDAIVRVRREAGENVEPTHSVRVRGSHLIWARLRVP